MGGISTTSVTIDGTTFDITTLAADRALPLTTLLMRFTGGAIGAVLFGGDESNAAMRAAVSQASEMMATPEFQRLFYGLLEAVSVNGKQLVMGDRRDQFNAVFSGRILTAYKVAFASGRHNFSDFFDAFLALVGRLQPAGEDAKAESPNPRPASPGKSRSAWPVASPP